MEECRDAFPVHAFEVREDGHPQHPRLRGMPRRRRHLGASSPVPGVRARRLLRRFEEQARHQAFQEDRASDHDLPRAGRELELVLCRRARHGARMSGESGGGEAAPSNPIEARWGQAFPRLTPAQIARLEAHGKRSRTRRAEVLVEPGERHPGLFVILSGSVEAVRPGMAGEELIVVHTPGQFSGEMSSLRGVASVVRVRVREEGEILIIDYENLRAIVQTDTELSEILMRAFILRRVGLIASQSGDVILIGSRHSAGTLRLQQFLTRNGFPYLSIDVEKDPSAQAPPDWPPPCMAPPRGSMCWCSKRARPEGRPDRARRSKTIWAFRPASPGRRWPDARWFRRRSSAPKSPSQAAPCACAASSGPMKS